MPSVQHQREKLIDLLKQLFQLDQPDLDFGFYKIMHAKSEQVQRFLENDLLDIIKQEFGNLDGNRVEEAKTKYEQALEQAKKFGAPNPDETDGVKEAKAEYDNAKQGGSPEGEIYDHLWRFFERYYDNGDFLSRRYYARETAGKAAPYAIPYDGREVYLHWANKDQYYIKTSEYLSNFTFNPTQSREYKEKAGELLSNDEQGLDNLKVHCRIVEATEGEHANIKTSEGQQRYFIIDSNRPVYIENGELIIQFQYRTDPTRKGQGATWRLKRLNEATERVLAELNDLPEAKVYLDTLSLPSPTDKQKDRTLLAKYLDQYTARNSMDYFIHKDLGSFLYRELDFYIKNEVMRLDDIEYADAPKVEGYLGKVSVLRKIAKCLIEFLAQLEEFQKKLWLKKKFVTETNYCITLDRIPESLYPEIADNDKQREEWVKLFAIDVDRENDKAQADLLKPGSPKYSVPLSVEFLKSEPNLVLDTCFFDADFKQKLFASIGEFYESCDGILIHSDNFHALQLIDGKLREQVKCMYLDPPYNTDVSSIPYKNNYRHSSWASLMKDRLEVAKNLVSQDGAVFVSIDKAERTMLEYALDTVFGNENKVEELIWVQNTNDGRSPTYSTNHEYVLVYSKYKPSVESDHEMFREPKPGYSEVMSLVNKLNPHYPSIEDVEKEIAKLYENHKRAYREMVDSQDLDWNVEKRNDPWKGIYPYSKVEYRDSNGKYVSEKLAKDLGATIWVWTESDWTIMSSESKQSDTTRDPDHPNYRYYQPTHPVTKKLVKLSSRGWKGTQFIDPDYPERNSFESLNNDNRIAWGADEKKVPRQKRFLHEVETNVCKSVFTDYSDGEKELVAMFGKSGMFLAPKHTNFVSRFISQAAKNDSVILDYFGGSGSTGDAVIKMNQADGGQRKYVLAEMGNHFDTILKPRLQKAIYTNKWRQGVPDPDSKGISHCMKYIRLESYEDALNNLSLDESVSRNQSVQENDTLRRDYMLKYWLDMETQGSPSLLNIEQFIDPTSYTLKVKKPGTDEYEDKPVDLIETFNWLIGLHVEHMDVWRGFDAKFKREKDPELPKDGHTKLVIDGKLKETQDGAFALRKIEGWVCRTPGNTEDREKVLVVWRKLSGNLEEDNEVLDEWFRKLDIRSRDSEFDVIYVNGSNNLPNLRREGEHWKVRLLEETFHQKMWDIEDV
ncbi:MAG: site-specific DNA-methyltransferase [Candidatus Thiodiazotropha endolucinida]